jgi:D-alanyl-D-alanine carboxypeptidase
MTLLHLMNISWNLRRIHWSVLLTIAVALTLPTRADQIDRFIERQLKKQNIPGLALAVVREGKVTKAKGYGLADVELNVPVKTDSVFQWASISKQFTATAIQQLALDGRLKLDDRISLHYTNAPATWSNVTVYHLLTHTSGIKSYTGLPNFFATVRKDYRPEEVIGLVRNLPLEFLPGEKWDYSNTGYFLLGLILEKASGQAYGDFLATRIFRPAGMATARINQQFELIPNRATGYTSQSNRLVRSEFVSPTQPFSAGALVGTVLDLAKWDASLYTDLILPRQAREEAWKPVRLSTGEDFPYGYGWQTGELRGHPWVGHGGGIDGFSSFILRLTRERLTVIVLINKDADPQGMAISVAGHYLSELTLRSIKPQPDSEPVLSQRLQQCLVDLAARKDSELITPGFRRNFARSQRRHAALQEDLRGLKFFTFLLEEKPARDQREVEGVPIARLRSYKLRNGGEPRYYTFALTAENKVGLVRASDD